LLKVLIWGILLHWELPWIKALSRFCRRLRIRGYLGFLNPLFVSYPSGKFLLDQESNEVIPAYSPSSQRVKAHLCGMHYLL
jgi:hypothetical protein